MEKLIELLNEYKKIKGYDGDTKIIDYNTNTLSFTNGYSLLDYEIVIGKRYGFIKWLVDNDKIDTSYKKHGENRPYKLHQFSGKVEKYSQYDTILMQLSIQDEPIEFLISILK